MSLSNIKNLHLFDYFIINQYKIEFGEFSKVYIYSKFHNLSISKILWKKANSNYMIHIIKNQLKINQFKKLDGSIKYYKI